MTEYDKIVFSPILREETLETFKNLCHDESIEFLKLFQLNGKLYSFLHTKSDDTESKEYFTMLLNVRIRDHFSSSFILISQGFLVDAISLTRSALEDLFVIINFYLEPSYFQRWNENKDSFKIRPGKLRNHEFIDDNDKELFNNVYESLCNIVHPKKNSVSHMARYHPSLKSKGTEGIVSLKKDASLINLSFLTYLYHICKLLKTVYTDSNDINLLDSILGELPSIINILSLTEQMNIE